MEALLRVAETAVRESQVTLDIAKVTFDVAKAAVNQAKYTLDAAVAALEVVQHTYRIGVEAATLISSIGLGNMISIEKLEFEVSLSTAATGAFSGSVTACFAGQASTTISIHIDLFNPISMARELGEHVVSGLSSLF